MLELLGCGDGDMVGRERSKFLAWVNQVLKLHLCPSLDKFRVSFYLDSRDSCYIDEWIKVLEIDLGPVASGTRYSPSQECYLSFKSPSNLSSIKCLTSLLLTRVDINGELIEYFLSNSPNMEQLRLFWLDQIVNLTISGPSLKLKLLEIFRCKFLESLEFCAPKLVTFKYFGHSKIRLSLGSLPHLAELDIGASHDHQPEYAFVPFSSYLSQIETLKFRMFLTEGYEEIPQIPKLTKLKHLKIFLFHFEAAPSLHKFTFNINLNTHESPNMKFICIQQKRSKPQEDLAQ
ncbi:hypothetical protein RHGRI_030538 [Rhododendron griersonianum]|uniref:At1g61320/AtMIF1 LRR domain-containing protein n=1 Tax=Rhododendron griersonianum TaxID=479676 RepID=A0AAV6IUC6_9ERIC|nr:hypothetical protein RHGRI_030538 [Rhododendron griersonianum]